MKEVERSYSLSDAELYNMSSEVVQFMTRDETEFLARNISVADRTAFDDAATAFINLDGDSYYVTLITEAVDEKNAKQDETRKLIQKISGYFQQEWGLGSPQYKGLGIKGLQNMTDAQFLVAAKQVKRRADDRLAVLSPLGLTQGNIDDLESETQDYDDALDSVALAEENRQKKTEDRILAGNSLYVLLAKYCEIGKLIWENVSEANYSDYIIYKTVHHGLSKVQNLMAQQSGQNAYDLTWDLVVDADYYEVELAESTGGQPQGPWQQYQTSPTPPVGFVANPGFTYWIRVRARDNQGRTGSWSDEAIV